MNIDQKNHLTDLGCTLVESIHNYQPVEGLIRSIIRICESSSNTALDIARIGLYAAHISRNGYPEVYRVIMNSIERIGNI